MSSLDAAPAASTSTTPRAQVIGRELIWNGDEIIQISVPKDAQPGVYDQGKGRVPYLSFDRIVKGGAVKIFVHTSDLSLRGKKICAEVAILRKDLDDGRSYYYIDLIPVEDIRPTHRLCIVMQGDHGELPSGWPRFDTSSPVFGTIILASPSDAKIPQRPSYY